MHPSGRSERAAAGMRTYMNSPKIATSGTATLAEYRRVEAELRDLIGKGNWPVGAMLPSRRDLARQYSVSLVTLDRAIGPLLADGILRADDRRGTFIARLTDPSAMGSRASAPAGAVIDRHAPSAEPAQPTRRGQVGIVTILTNTEGPEYLILRELEQILSQKGHTALVLDRLRDITHPLPLTQAIAQAIDAGVTALMVICLDIDRTSVAEQMSRANLGSVPTVCILAGELNLAIPHVFYDNRSGGYQAVQHLLENGWQDITVIAPFAASWVSERIAGVRDAVTYAKLPAGRIQVLGGDGVEWANDQDPYPPGYQTAKAALAAGWRPTGGVVCVNDGVAFGVLDAAAECGLEPGKDFAIVGFDDDPHSRAVGLTSMRPPLQAMAREASRLLFDYMQDTGNSIQVRLRAHVIPRSSTSPREQSATIRSR